jgi:hypothetical protein
MLTSSRKRVSLDWKCFNWVVSEDVIEHLFLPRLLVKCAFSGLKKQRSTGYRAEFHGALVLASYVKNSKHTHTT